MTPPGQLTAPRARGGGVSNDTDPLPPTNTSTGVSPHTPIPHRSTREGFRQKTPPPRQGKGAMPGTPEGSEARRSPHKVRGCARLPMSWGVPLPCREKGETGDYFTVGNLGGLLSPPYLKSLALLPPSTPILGCHSTEGAWEVSPGHPTTDEGVPATGGTRYTPWSTPGERSGATPALGRHTGYSLGGSQTRNGERGYAQGAPTRN